MLGVDYSTSKPDLVKLRTAGIKFVCRYLSYPLSTGKPNPKVITSGERAALHDAGFGILLNWEQSANDMLLGYGVGAAHATKALSLANALGCPSHIPIYFSCDFDATTSQLGPVGKYLDGCASVLGRQRVGVYGGIRTIEAMLPEHATWGWQTYAWSHGALSPKAHVYQYQNNVTIAGASCDCDRSVNSSFRLSLWYPGVDMPLTPSDLTAIADAVWTHKLNQGNPGYAGQQAETAEAFAWEASLTAARNSAAVLTAVEDLKLIVGSLVAKIDTLPAGGLSDVDRTAIAGLTDAVNALNNRLATP